MSEYFNHFRPNDFFVRPTGNRLAVMLNQVANISSSAASNQVTHLSSGFAHHSFPVHYGHIRNRALSCPQMSSPNVAQPAQRIDKTKPQDVQSAQHFRHLSQSRPNTNTFEANESSCNSTTNPNQTTRSFDNGQRTLLPVQPVPRSATSSSAFRKPSEVRVLSRNSNGTIAMTSQPSNESELQLYRVLQRANLLSYYDTFICQGGDDVQQLCDAGEEEFLEIMALVGMATKPLHVRRLQKSLQEWIANPAQFQQPLMPIYPGQTPPSVSGSTSNSSSLASAPSGSVLQATLTPSNAINTQHVSVHSQSSSQMAPTLTQSKSIVSSQAIASAVKHSSVAPTTSTHLPLPYPNLVNNIVPICSAASISTASAINGTMSNAIHALKLPPPPMPMCPNPLTNAALIGSNMLSMNPCAAATAAAAARAYCHPQQQQQSGIMIGSALVRPSTGISLCTSPTRQRDAILLPLNQPLLSPSAADRPDRPESASDRSQANSPLCLPQMLLDSEIQKLTETAVRYAPSIPPNEPKLQNGKRKINKELEYVMSMTEDDPRYMNELRKYAAIYGGISCKRKNERTLTMHEMYVNEAAFQLCKLVPSLLVRRDELFPMARRVVKDAGYPYSKGHSRSQCTLKLDDSINNHSSNSNASVTSGSNLEGGNSVGSSRAASRTGADQSANSPRQASSCNVNENPATSENGELEEEEDDDEEEEELDITNFDAEHKNDQDGKDTHPNGKLDLPSENDQCTFDQLRLEQVHQMLKRINCQQEELRLQLAINCDSTPTSKNSLAKIQAKLEILTGQQLQLLNEQTELRKQFRNGKESPQPSTSRSNTVLNSSDFENKDDSDDTDSQFSIYSNSSSPQTDSGVRKTLSPTPSPIELDHLRNGTAKMKTKLSNKRKFDSGKDELEVRYKKRISEDRSSVKQVESPIHFGVDLRVSGAKQQSA